MDRRQLNPVTGLWKGTPFDLLQRAWHDVAGGWLPAGAVVRRTDDQWLLGEQAIAPMSEVPSSTKGPCGIGVSPCWACPTIGEAGLDGAWIAAG